MIALSEALTERRLAAIILGDVVGYSRLMGSDEVGTMAALKAHRQHVVLPALAARRARLVDAPGDAMLMEFGSAVSAVSCAIDIQRRMLTRNMEVPTERQLRFRLGINLGDIVVDGDKIYGDGINVAARLESLCEPGGLCISRSIHEQIRGRLPFPFVDAGEKTLKNIAHPVQVFQLSAEFIATLPEPELPEPTSSLPVSVALPGSPAVQATLQPGSVLNDTYRIDTAIGSGGMGDIFRGHEIHSGGGVAIKVIRPDMIENKIAAALFQKEALILKDINHDAVVRYYSFSYDQTLRRHYLAMEFVDGPALPQFLKKGPLPFEAVSALRRRVAAGLQIAHERGIIHRDIASDNIIVPMNDLSRAKIIDFGIARAPEIGATTIIGDGFAGKYNYASPEQFGLAGGEISRQSDIYSLGLVLAEVSQGAPLDMGGTQAEVLEKRRTVPDLQGVDPRLRPLLERMLQPQPHDRPGSMQEVADWTAGAPQPIPASAPRPQPPARPASPSTRKSGARQRPLEHWIIGGALLLALLIGVALGAFALLPPKDKPRIATADIPTEPGSAPDGQASQAPKPPITTRPGETPPPPADQPRPPDGPLPNQAGTNQNEPPPSDESSQPTEAPPSSAQADRIASYVRTYAGGDCFLALPVRVSATSAAIDGFAQDKTAFEAFDTAFTREFGFSPEIVGNRIWTRQCPTLEFLRQAQTGAITEPALLLKSTKVGSGRSLAGEIHGAGANRLALLLVQQDGTVVDLSKLLKDSGNAKIFDISIPAVNGTGPFPQMLVSLASSAPLEALQGGGALTADRLFPALLNEAKTKAITLGANAKFFLVTP